MHLHTTQIRLRATPEQLQALDAACAVSEELFAYTLADYLRRLPSNEEWVPSIQSWFMNVRMMAHAQFLISGVRALPEMDRFDAVQAFLQETYGITPSQNQNAELRKVVLCALQAYLKEYHGIEPSPKQTELLKIIDG